LTVPAHSARETGLVLHALLLHNGLPLEMLPRVLPLSLDEIVQVLSRFEAAELVTRDEDGRYRVSALGYPAARLVVSGLGYMKD
jgi:DNA-binding transcriptional ArsR family regulator